MPSVRDLAKQFATEAAEMLCKDATYIPEEKLDWRPMDHAKSANMILAECAKVNLMVAAALRGEQASDVELNMEFMALKAHVIDSAEVICKAIDSLSDQDLEGETRMPWGMMFPTSSAILLPTSHMNYHDGQINYIQLLLGDTKFHWAGE